MDRLVAAGVCALALLGCQRSTAPSASHREADAGRQASPPLAAYTRTAIGPGVFLEVRRETPFAAASAGRVLLGRAGAALSGGPSPFLAPPQAVLWLPAEGPLRRVRVLAMVCLQQGYLEHLLTLRSASKAHESILAADIDARHLHAALLAAGARPGRPVQFVNDRQEPEFKPPQGDPIRVLLEYEDQGKRVRVPAQTWIRDVVSKKELEYDWVFAGSVFLKDPEGRRPDFYAANEGRVICTSNFVTALLDLPVSSSDHDLQYEINTRAVPPLDTPVWVILEPMAAKR